MLRCGTIRKAATAGIKMGAPCNKIRYISNYLDDYFSYVAGNPDFLMRAIVRNRRLDASKTAEIFTQNWDERYKIVQFWDTESIPEDVRALIDGWKSIVPHGCHVLYNSETARELIKHNFDESFVEAYEFCWHPAMQSDYFRLTYLFLNGGFYIDTDERAAGMLPAINFSCENLLVASPLIREKHKIDDNYKWLTLDDLCSTHPSIDGPVCYFNNNSIAVTPRNDIIKTTLMRATHNILSMKSSGVRRSIHIMTGPTCLTFSIAAHLLYCACTGVQPTKIAVIDRNGKFGSPLSSTVWCEYKSDNRYWAISEVKKI